MFPALSEQTKRLIASAAIAGTAVLLFSLWSFSTSTKITKLSVGKNTAPLIPREMMPRPPEVAEEPSLITNFTQSLKSAGDLTTSFLAPASPENSVIARTKNALGGMAAAMGSGFLQSRENLYRAFSREVQGKTKPVK